MNDKNLGVTFTSDKTLSYENLIIYSTIMNSYNGKNYRDLRVRIAIFLLYITSAKISEILLLKVGCLKTLQKKFLIKVGDQVLFIQDEHCRFIINERTEDIKIISTIKDANDFIFTTDLNLHAEKPLRRESFTKLVNNVLQTTSEKLGYSKNLTSRTFKNSLKNQEIE